jgi:hypothetical protein
MLQTADLFIESGDASTLFPYSQIPDSQHSFSTAGAFVDWLMKEDTLPFCPRGRLKDSTGPLLNYRPFKASEEIQATTPRIKLIPCPQDAR